MACRQGRDDGSRELDEVDVFCSAAYDVARVERRQEGVGVY